VIAIKGYNETLKRGVKGFPFEVYRCKGAQKGDLIARPHYHNELEMLLPYKGITDIVIEGQTVNAVENNIYIVNPNEVHAVYTNTESYFHAIVFPKELLMLGEGSIINTQLLTPLFEGRKKLRRVITDSAAVEIFKEISELSVKSEENAPLIIAALYRLLWQFKQQGNYLKTESKSKEPIYFSIDYMEANLDKKLALADIASKAKMSPKYFCAYFKKYTGLTTVTYLNTLRIRRAQQLLKTTDYSVLEISLLCGFDNVSFFIKKFKEAVGKTPAKYRKI